MNLQILDISKGRLMQLSRAQVMGHLSARRICYTYIRMLLFWALLHINVQTDTEKLIRTEGALQQLLVGELEVCQPSLPPGLGNLKPGIPAVESVGARSLTCQTFPRCEQW